MQDKLFKNVSIFGLPVGWILSRTSYISMDEISKNGVEVSKKIIESKNEGLAIFIAHLGILDLFGTATVLERVVDYKAVFPIAASWYYFPLIYPIFKSLKKQLNHKFIPVFRKEEMGYSKFSDTIIDYSGLDHDEKKLANKKYVEETQEILADGEIVMLSPYGGRAPKLEYMRSGPVMMASTGVPIVFSFTYWNWKKFKYEVFFSKIYRFNEKINKETLHEKTFSEFYRMAKINGLTKKKITNVKSGNGLLSIVWNLLLPIFKVQKKI